jgi:hypothetical protein
MKPVRAFLPPGPLAAAVFCENSLKQDTQQQRDAREAMTPHRFSHTSHEVKPSNRSMTMDLPSWACIRYLFSPLLYEYIDMLQWGLSTTTRGKEKIVRAIGVFLHAILAMTPTLYYQYYVYWQQRFLDPETAGVCRQSFKRSNGWKI